MIFVPVRFWIFVSVNGRASHVASCQVQFLSSLRQLSEGTYRVFAVLVMLYCSLSVVILAMVVIIIIIIIIISNITIAISTPHGVSSSISTGPAPLAPTAPVAKAAPLRILMLQTPNLKL